MKKRILSAALALALMLPMSGCLPQSNTTGSGNNTSSSTSQNVDPNKPLAMGDVENPVTLTMVIKDHSPENKADADWIKLLNEELLKAGIGAQVELVAMQSGSYSTNLGLMLSGGNIPDLIWFQGGDEEFALTQKILVDMTDYVENSVYMKDAMEEYQLQRLENYPYLVYLTPASVKVPVMRSDVLDSLSIKDEFLANPTIDNYHKLFQELKAKGYEAVWTVPGDLSEINNTFDQAFGLTSTWLKQEDGSYIYAPVSDQAKEKLQFYAQLYKEGILDNDYLTDTWETKENKFYSGQTAIVSGTQGRRHRRLQQQPGSRQRRERQPDRFASRQGRCPGLHPLLRGQGDPRHGHLRPVRASGSGLPGSGLHVQPRGPLCGDPGHRGQQLRSGRGW